MLSRAVRCICVLFLSSNLCNGQIFKMQSGRYEPGNPLPFPTCKADDIDCLRRGFRTFFFLMESGHIGMRPIDPAIVNSVAVSLPEQRVSFLLRRVNVTGAKWTKLVERRFHAYGGHSGAIFNSDLHSGAEIILKIADRAEPYIAYITMDTQDVETNITYTWAGTNVNNEDYILIGPERIAVRNRRVPTYFLQPINNNLLDMNTVEAALQAKTSVLDHFSNEIVTAVMHTVLLHKENSWAPFHKATSYTLQAEVYILHPFDINRLPFVTCSFVKRSLCGTMGSIVTVRDLIKEQTMGLEIKESSQSA